MKDIPAYNRSQRKDDRAICDLLKREFDAALPKAESKIWHGGPVWFLEGNPIVGYHKLKEEIRILFWSGQSFEEDGLVPEGTFKAAEVRYTHSSQVEVKPLRRWLAKAKRIQWDYKNIVKRKGVLKRLEVGAQVRRDKNGMNKNKSGSVAEYISSFPPSTRKILQGFRKAVRAAVPGAREKISYGMPAYAVNGVLVYFAAYRNHIGFYPTSSGVRVFKDELNSYKTSRGAVQFPIDKPLPMVLIKRITKFRAEEDARRAMK